MLKIGDKLLCKKSYNGVIEGEYYIVTLVKSRFEGKYYYSIINIDNDNVYFVKYYYIWDYFYKPQEVRKLKLKQLNNA